MKRIEIMAEGFYRVSEGLAYMLSFGYWYPQWSVGYIMRIAAKNYPQSVKELQVSFKPDRFSCGKTLTFDDRTGELIYKKS